MNYSLCNLPFSGEIPTVFMDIMLRGVKMGQLQIKLFREVFPAGVENFVKIAEGTTYQCTATGSGRYQYKKFRQRTYAGCRFFGLSYNNFMTSGDIYNNNGTNAGTIYNDQPIPAVFGNTYIPHDRAGLISLVPYLDEQSNRVYYDSTFMITLDHPTPTNRLGELDANQIVIGNVCSGMDIIAKMNNLIRPFAGRRYPVFEISRSGLYNSRAAATRSSMLARFDKIAPLRMCSCDGLHCNEGRITYATPMCATTNVIAPQGGCGECTNCKPNLRQPGSADKLDEIECSDAS